MQNNGPVAFPEANAKSRESAVLSASGFNVMMALIKWS